MKALRVLTALAAVLSVLALTGCKADVDDDSVTVEPAAKVKVEADD